MKFGLVVGLGLLASSAVAAEPAGPVVYSANHRAPMAFFLTYASQGSVKTGDTSSVLEAVDEALAEATGLYRSKLSAGQVAHCAKDFTVLDLCVFNSVFADLDYLSPQAPRTPEAALQRVRSRPDYERLVFNVSVAEVRGRQDVFIRVFSSTTAAAVLAVAQAEATATGAPLEAFELQAVLNKQAVRTVRRLEVDNLADPRLYRGLFDELQVILQAYSVPAEVAIGGEDVPQGTLLSMDGTDLGLVGALGARIIDLSPGVHTLKASADGYVVVEIPLNLKAGQVAQVELTFLSELASNLARPGLGVAGGLILGAGIGVLAWSAQAHRHKVCYVSPQYNATPTGCPGGVLAGPRSDKLAPDAVGPSIPLLPLGLAVTAVGGAVSAGAVWWGELDEAPWGWIAGGALLGAAAAGTVWALDQPDQ